MAHRQRTFAWSAAAIAGLLGGQVLLAGAAFSGTVVAIRYASPTGGGVACSTAAPCDITTAVNDAPAGAEVVIAPGQYGSPTTPLGDALVDNGAGLDVHGVVGRPLPVIFSNAVGGAVTFANNSTVSHLAISYSGSGVGVGGSGTADHIRAVATQSNAAACGMLGTLADSLCLATEDDGTAIRLLAGTSDPAAITGVTAEAPGLGGIALSSSTTASVGFTVTATNDIFRGNAGDGEDIYLNAIAGSAETVVASHIDYAVINTSGGPGPASIQADPTVTDQPPAYVDAAHGNYRETAHSPTVDTGDPAAVTAGETDLAGFPRSARGAPDMGAYEYVRKPTAHGLKVIRRTKHSLRVRLQSNPEGLATTVKLIATHKGHSKTKHVAIGAGRVAKTVHLRLSHLKRHTTYRLRAKATNQAGTVATAKKRASTK